MLIYHMAELRSFSKEQHDIRKDQLDAEMHDAQGPWTMKTAFYATSGSCIYRSKYTTGKTMNTLDFETLNFLAAEESETLLPVKIAASQNSGQSSGIAKIITCVQAAWFCSQCISRMSSGMAISLLELNTFAHCVSAFFIYGFWWHKPHDINSYAFLQSKMLDFVFLRDISVEACQQSHGSDTMRVRLYAHKNTVHLANVTVNLVRAHSVLETNDLFLKFSNQDMVPRTGFSFHSSGLRSPFVLLPKDSLAHWQRLWRFTVENSFAIASVDPNNTFLQSEKRLKNIGGDYQGMLLMMLDPAAESSSANAFTGPIFANIAFLSYGGLHLLAWRYHFRSTAESILWEIAGIFTVPSGAVPLLLIYSTIALETIGSGIVSLGPTLDRLAGWVSDGFYTAFVFFVGAWMIVNMAARTYLFVESYVALPNSPPSTYRIPLWTAYIPHI